MYDTSDYIDDFIKNIGLNLADLEKLGAALLSLGYLFYVNSSQIDRLGILNLYNGNETPEQIIVNGQTLVLSGYIVLYIVSLKRLEEKDFLNSVRDSNINISPYEAISISYLISVFANLLRFEAFIQILNTEDTNYTDEQ